MIHHYSHCIGLALAGLAVLPVAAEDRLSFNRDVRPILSDHCFACHGPDKNQRKSGLRLDDPAQPFQAAKSGNVPITRGKPAESEVIRRILSTDKEEVMPPPEAHKPLSEAQKETLRKWIEQGAEYQAHWAYLPPVKPVVPEGQNGVDYLVRRRLVKLGLSPSPAADGQTLARRLAFDLVGLPPTPEEAKSLADDPSRAAYESYVEKLLASEYFGERMAIGWLDVVRFADTIGYHSDNPRNVWPYRDYVIASFNRNKPFDRFVIEQVAGDLLPDASQETRVASAFNRLLLSTEEGGAQPKDYEARMLTDRVRAIGTAFLGQTTGCAQCHDHKFDPFTTRDFYALGAFFADVEEPIIGRREDGMLVLTKEQETRQAETLHELQTAKADFDRPRPELAASQEVWEKGLAEKPPRELAGILKKPSEKRSAEEKAKLTDAYKRQAPELADVAKRLAAAEKAKADFDAAAPKCLVSKSSAQPRVVRILPRGNWMDESGEIMRPDFPHYLPRPKTEGTPTRLDLARWLASKDNPLTARVFVNRLWKQFFGMGLSKVLDDLGAQGEPPVNPELLDWLACEFMDSGWDVKRLVRTIVTSGTYQQTSLASKEAMARDPYNRELARQSRFRLDAELVRDNALAVSGLLSRKIGGPSVKPYQPDGYWENLNFPVRSYDADQGEDQYRRGLYVWWQRSFLHPSMAAFDAPSREECAADRNRSNIPQQALTLLNDPTYVESARALAARVLRESPANDVDARIAGVIRWTLQRDPREEEKAALKGLLGKHLAEYRADPGQAEALLKTGLAPLPKDLDKAELAAWTSVARVALNLHETITRS